MTLREVLIASPHGTKADLARKTGLSRPTISRAADGVQCGPSSAVLIADAMGAPDRWPELVVVRPRSKHQPPPGDDPEGERAGAA